MDHNNSKDRRSGRVGRRDDDHRMRRLMHKLFDISVLIIFFGSLFIAYLYFIDGGKPLVLKTDVVPTVELYTDGEGNYVPKHTFRTGEQLTYLFEYCKTRNVPAELYGYYVDTVRVSMPVVKLKAPVGCNAVISDLYKIPKILPSGTYHFEVEVVYQVNPLRKVKIKYRTETFEIINNKL